MGALQRALSDVTAAMAQALEERVEVKGHPGRFTEDELGRIVLKHKAVRVAIEAVESVTVEGGGLRQANVRFAALVICGDRRGEDRHEAALEIIEDIVALVPYASWGDQQRYKAVAPNSVEITNLYNGDINGKGIAFWAVTWTQGIRQLEE
jgi:hypothetical protein